MVKLTLLAGLTTAIVAALANQLIAPASRQSSKTAALVSQTMNKFRTATHTTINCPPSSQISRRDAPVSQTMDGSPTPNQTMTSSPPSCQTILASPPANQTMNTTCPANQVLVNKSPCNITTCYLPPANQTINATRPTDWTMVNTSSSNITTCHSSLANRIMVATCATNEAMYISSDYNITTCYSPPDNRTMNETCPADWTVIISLPYNLPKNQTYPATWKCIDPQAEATELAWQQFAEICGACLGVAFILILGVVMGRLVTNWGWWRLRGPGPKPHYVKTWHGWVVRDDFKGNFAEPEKPQVLRQFWFWEWGLTRADYEWYCWDPHGHGKRREEEVRNRSYVRKLLRWIGIIKQDCQQAPTEDLAEKGESPKKPRHQRPSSGIRSPTSSCTTSADLT